MDCDRRWACERGDVVLDGLARVAAYLAVIALLAFEVIAVGVNMVQLDDLAGDVARQTANSLPVRAKPAVLQALAEQQARGELGERPGVHLRGVEVHAGGVVRVTLERTPNTVVLHRVPPVAARLPHAVTASGRPPTM